jgi:transcriptional regulator with XRE-family HTH domain
MGYRIKERREELGMTQEELEEKSGVSRAIISGLENDAKRNTTTLTLVKIANALDTTVDHIFFADDV